jgi:hypothetical protein
MDFEAHTKAIRKGLKPAQYCRRDEKITQTYCRRVVTLALVVNASRKVNFLQEVGGVSAGLATKEACSILREQPQQDGM